MSYTREFGGIPASSTYPRFHMEAVQDELATAREGRPIFRQEERVQIMTPGALSQPVFRVAEEHKQRWPEAYDKFRKGEEAVVDGTPIEHWPVLNKAMVLELKALEIRTVEQIAGLSDVALQRIKMGGQRMREMARSYLDEAAHAALVTSLNKDNEALTVRIAAMERQNAEMAALVTHLTTQVGELTSRPHPAATYTPPDMQAMVMAPTLGGGMQEGSSLAGLSEAPRRRGRPPNGATA